MLIALTRSIGPHFNRCELTHLPRLPIDVQRARRQHDAYQRCLAGLGCTVRQIPADPAHPDAVFIEDTAVVLDELAVITRPGAETRRAETAAVAVALRDFRPLHALETPATLDGGDVLRVGRTLFVGASTRTNSDGIRQLREIVTAHGYDVRAVAVHGCLHLKSAITEVADGVLLVNAGWIDAGPFAHHELIHIDAGEPFAANALRIGDALVYPAAQPRTAGRLRERGIDVHTVDVSELAKAEGGVTCCSLVVQV